MSVIRAQLALAFVIAFCLCSQGAKAESRAGYVFVDDGSLYYEVEGHGPPIVLLHSAFMDLHMWDHAAAELSKRHTVVRFDERGHGRSPFPTHPAAYYEDLRVLLDTLHIEKSDLIGSSLGGVIACDFAIAYPGRVRRLILVGAAPNIGTNDPEEAKRMTAMILAARERGVAAGVEKWLALPMNASATREAREKIRAVALENPSMFMLKFWPVKNLEPPATTRLGELHAPVLIISGMHDSPTLRADAARAAKELPNARLITFSRSGHFPNLEEPSRFLSVVSDFFDAGRTQ